MKQLLFAILIFPFLLSITSNNTFATAPLNDPKPEKIYPFTFILHPLDYYMEQAQLWKQELNTNNQNTDAWMNYYQAARIGNIFSDAEKPFDLDAIFAKLQKSIPNTFEYHYLAYAHSGGSHDLYHHLEKAYTLAPERYETYQGMIAYHEIHRNKAKLKEFCQKLYNSKETSPGLLAWNYNTLMSVEKNAILLTYGDNDTYPIWLLQNAKGVRTDVNAINIHLLMKDKYRAAIFKELDIPEFPNQQEDFVNMTDFQLAISYYMVKHLNRPVYLGIAMSREIRNQLSNNLYLVGLALKYNETSFNNIEVLKNNFENHFLTDHLEVNFEDDFSASILNQLNMNYIPAFMLLHKWYLENEQFDQAKEIERLSKRIAKAGSREDEIIGYLQQQSIQYGKIESILTHKELEKGLVEIEAKKWAYDTEVTNEQYERFLMDLLKNKKFDLLEVCKTTKTDWRALLPAMHQNISEEVYNYHGDPDEGFTPVQNISYEAAKIYCDWMTNVYNNTPRKKSSFSKVKFRLPSEQEWMDAAQAGRDQAVYPWGGYYYKNAKGCYLSNFYVSEEPQCTDCKAPHPANDGGFFPVKADAYFPNDKGLYGLCGNVAEMVQEKGIAKGGSWEDKPEDCKIQSQKQYKDISPAIGFRVFMDVIE